MLNNVVLVGRVADEPKQFILDSGVKVSNFVLAVNKVKKDGETEADFLPIRAWFTLSDVVKDYVHKGATVGVKAHLSTRINDVSGTKVKVVDIMAEQVVFISPKSSNKSGKEEEKFNDLNECDSSDGEVSE